MQPHIADEVEEAAAADAGPRERPIQRERLCVATRTVRPIEELIRFVVGPDGGVVPDIKRNLPGRGVWVTATRQALQTALARQAFARSLKQPLKAPADLVETTERLLERAALDALSMAHKAGRVVTGFARVEGALATPDFLALIHAAEAAADGVRKLAAALRQIRGGEVPIPASITTFTSAQLDLALGRSNVIHAALLAGPASETFLVRHKSLLGFRSVEQA